jgi:YD repeat-containing protein
VTVADTDGTVFYFPNQATNLSSAGLALISLPQYVEDRNGNKVVFNPSPNSPQVFSVTDSSGRTLISTTGFGQSGNQVTVSGIPQPFTIYWQTTPSPSWSLGPQNLFPSNSSNCPGGWPGSPGNLGSAIQSILLPNNQRYRFYYDGTYGLLNKIVYPSGGYVSYTWGVNPQAEASYWPDTNNFPTGCEYRYGMPAITKRVVSFDGTTQALQETFSYSTPTWSSSTNLQWTSKKTTVTTTNLISGTSYSTVYNYVPGFGVVQPNDAWTANPAIRPTESSIQHYKDTNTAGTPLLAVAKSWGGMGDLLSCEMNTLNNGLISVTIYQYGQLDVITDKQEFDYGTASSCQTNATPTRETKATFQTFSSTPIFSSAPSIFDRPATVKVYGSGVLVSETDYAYDETPVTGLSSLTGHDETHYPASYNNRGNLTTKTVKCLQTGCPNAVTKYSYDETGQVLTMTDPCGNASCIDMTGTSHITNYSYTDTYTILSGGQNVNYTPSANTNTYLTTTTDPLGHTQNFKYDYNTGQLTAAKDANGKSTAYLYNDPLARPTQANYPDTGLTQYFYTDAVGNVNLEKKKSIDGTAQPMSSLTMTAWAIRSATALRTEKVYLGTRPTLALTALDARGSLPTRTRLAASYLRGAARLKPEIPLATIRFRVSPLSSTPTIVWFQPVTQAEQSTSSMKATGRAALRESRSWTASDDSFPSAK